jgi:hypothetical protein
MRLRVLKWNESLSGQVAYLEKHRLGEEKNPNFQCLQAYRASWAQSYSFLKVYNLQITLIVNLQNENRKEF